MYNQKNNKGMSSILFAMVFATVLSLLAVGFATLVRNDQRQALDQSLGYQAQYAAETAVNQVQAELTKSGSLSPAATPDCQPPFNIITGNDAKATCVKWSDTGKTIKFDSVGNTPASVQLNSAGMTTLKLNWLGANGGTNTKYTVNSGVLPNTIGTLNYPILKVATAKADGTGFKQFYLVPTSGAGVSTVDYTGITDGGVYYVTCAASACELPITTAGGLVDNFFAISTIGAASEQVTLTSDTDFVGVQYTVDVTAIAQDITKRVEARLSPNKSTWRPGAAVSTNKICKDIKVDGTNGTSISSAGAACPLVTP